MCILMFRLNFVKKLWRGQACLGRRSPKLYEQSGIAEAYNTVRSKGRTMIFVDNHQSSEVYILKATRSFGIKAFDIVVVILNFTSFWLSHLNL